MKSPSSKVIIISILVVNTILGGYLLIHDMNNQSGDINTEIQRYEEIQRRVLDSNCPKCGGQFENGFLLDRSRSSLHVTTWVQGSPKVEGAGVNEEPASPVVTKRCKACGFLESYAK
jgi:hypothetical protein